MKFVENIAEALENLDTSDENNEHVQKLLEASEVTIRSLVAEGRYEASYFMQPASQVKGEELIEQYHLLCKGYPFLRHFTVAEFIAFNQVHSQAVNDKQSEREDVLKKMKALVLRQFKMM